MGTPCCAEGNKGPLTLKQVRAQLAECKAKLAQNSDPDFVQFVNALEKKVKEMEAEGTLKRKGKQFVAMVKAWCHKACSKKQHNEQQDADKGESSNKHLHKGLAGKKEENGVKFD
jgi:hypothetical protein